MPECSLPREVAAITRVIRRNVQQDAAEPRELCSFDPQRIALWFGAVGASFIVVDVQPTDGTSGFLLDARTGSAQISMLTSAGLCCQQWWIAPNIGAITVSVLEVLLRN